MVFGASQEARKDEYSEHDYTSMPSVHESTQQKTRPRYKTAFY